MIDLDAEEKELLESYEKDEWQPVKDQKKLISHYREIAKATYKKDSRVNIRMSRKDVLAIQVKALEEGIPYQTLISSILHKYISGKLTEKKL